MRTFSLPISLLAFAVSFLHLGQAHRSLPEGVTCGNQFNSSATALVIPDPKISWASYRLLTCDAPVMWLKGTMTKGQRLSFTAGVPVLPRLKSAHMSVVVIGPGLPPLSTAHAAKVPQSVKDSIPQGQGAILTESPQDQSTCAHVHSAEMGKSSSVKDGRCHFHEEYAGSHSWVLIDNNVSTVEAGVHHLAVFTPTQINAKVWFACCDWPEDFQAQYTIPAANCPYCGTKATNPSWSDLFYEQKAMVPHGGFPAADSCASSTKPPTAPTTAQCPALPDTTPEQQSESCKLGCSKGECHSHNVLGVCNYTVQWITPSAKMGNAEVKTLRIFAGESVKYTSLGHAFPHNLVAMETKAKLESCDFSAKTVVGDVGQLKMGKVIKYTKPGTYNYACEIGNHCQQGQKITVVVQDASDGMRCHDHKVTPSAAAVKKCPPSTVKASIVNSSAYGSAKGQCSELCTTEAAMQWMAGAKKGPCQDQGYGEMIEEKQVQPAGSPAKMTVTIMGNATDACAGMVQAYTVGSGAYGAGLKECSEFCSSEAALKWMAATYKGSCKDAGFEKFVKTVQVQPAGSPAKMSVKIMAKPSTCHCHSYEKIDCAASGDALYKEHIEEIVANCAGVINGTDAMCPYKCHQPFEVLHLYYLECSTRAVDATYVKINSTGICHNAAPAESESKCSSSTNKSSEPEPEPEPEPTAKTYRAKMTVTFADPEAFVKSPHAKAIMKHAVSNASTDLKLDMIEIETLSVASGRRLTAGMRRLAGGVDCQFTVTYPATHKGPTFTPASIDVAKLKTSIMDKAASLDLTVTVTGAVVNNPVLVTTPAKGIDATVGVSAASGPKVVSALIVATAFLTVLPQSL